jgi:Spy/CpxP family protein refolding chaperone
LNARFLAAVVVVLTLVIGFLIGLLTTRVTERRLPGPDRPHPPMGGRMMDGGFFTERMERILDVGDDQRDTVRAILDAHADRFVAMHEQQSEAMKNLMDTLLTDLRSVLTEDQVSQFEEHLNSRRGFRRGPRFDKGPP